MQFLLQRNFQVFFRKLKQREIVQWQNGLFWLKLIAFILFVSLGYFTLTYEYQTTDNTKKQELNQLKKLELKQLEELRKSFQSIRKISDPLFREYKLYKEAERLKIPSGNYRSMFNVYLRNQKLLPDYPENKSSIFEWFKWFFINVSAEKRREIIRNFFFLILEKGVVFTVAIALVNYFREIPQRKKQELYQALQALQLIFNQPTQNVRKRVLESLNNDKISLAELIAQREDLSGISLKNVQLSKAILIGTNLGGANLEGANLEGANLEEANLEGANLEGANLEGANLQRTNLTDVNLEDAKLKSVNLEDANLQGANLKYANLEDANLKIANLENADLKGANLDSADLRSAKNLTKQQVQASQNGDKAWDTLIK